MSFSGNGRRERTNEEGAEALTLRMINPRRHQIPDMEKEITITEEEEEEWTCTRPWGVGSKLELKSMLWVEENLQKIYIFAQEIYNFLKRSKISMK